VDEKLVLVKPTGPEEPATVGQVIGNYRIVRLLGAGGMGVVYLAEHTRLGRRVALKTLRSEFAENPQAVRRFFGEAHAVNKIRHQNIVEITDFVENAGGDNYYIMELLRGQTLSNVIDHEGVQPLARSVGIMTQVARALQAVHDAGIIHRDLKPDNVFLTERSGQPDFVKLLDFGVAKLIDSVESIGVHSTAAGAILGTPEYMSPEQASGKLVDHRTDIYSFGILLYELVTGKLPLIGANFGELVVAHLTITPTAPSRVPGLPHVVSPELEDTILACMEKDENARPDRIDTVADQLDAIAEANGWELPTYTAIPRSSTRMNALSGPIATGGSGPNPAIITPLRRTPPKGLPAMAHAPTVEIAPKDSGPIATDTSGVLPVPANTSGVLPVPANTSGSLPIAPPANRWPLFAAAAAVLIAGTALIAVNLSADQAATPAPAPAPTPPPPPPPPAASVEPAPKPEVIEIELASKPSGADVVQLSDGKLLGQTPITLRFDRSDREVSLELRLAGYVSQAQSVRLDRGSRISTVLTGAPVAEQPKPSRSRAKTTRSSSAAAAPVKPVTTTQPPKDPAKPDRTGVMDPFQQ